MKIEVVKEVEEIKSHVSNSQTIDEGFKLFSELLKVYRDKQNNQLLQLCRQIQKIEIENNKANIIAEDKVLDALSKNLEYYGELKQFFNNQGLGLKINNIDDDSPEIVLRDWLGKKLVVIN